MLLDESKTNETSLSEGIEEGENLSEGSLSGNGLSDSGLSGDTSLLGDSPEVSMAVARALADSLTKIAAYVPTTWVNNSEPDMDANNLNHIEQGIMRVTNLMNGAVDVIKDLQSQITTLNGELPIIFKKFPNKKDVNIADVVTDYRNNNELCGYFFSWGNVTDAPDNIIGGYVLFFAEPQVTGNTCLIYLTQSSVYFGRIYQGAIYWSTRVASIH